MGKASRRKADRSRTPKGPVDPGAQPPPFARRPFEGLPGEAGWVAMREIVPAATAGITFSLEGTQYDATVASVLPLAWPALHRTDGRLLLALQTGGTSGDASRDLAQALIAVAALEPGEPLTAVPRVTASTPRLQDLLTGSDFDVHTHEGFDFWVEGQDLDEETQASLTRANEAATPTVALPGTTHAYWCRIGERTYVRWVLPQDEDTATDALARLHAAGTATMGDGRLLGAFRAHGLLVPVWEVDREAEPTSYDEPMTQLAARYDEALGTGGALTAEERRSRSGLVSRQLTLR